MKKKYTQTSKFKNKSDLSRLKYYQSINFTDEEAESDKCEAIRKIYKEEKKWRIYTNLYSLEKEEITLNSKQICKLKEFIWFMLENNNAFYEQKLYKIYDMCISLGTNWFPFVTEEGALITKKINENLLGEKLVKENAIFMPLIKYTGNNDE